MSSKDGTAELRVNGGWLAGLKLVIVLLPLLLAAHITFGAWCVSQITELRLDVAKIEATRFKATNGQSLERQLATTQAELDALESRLGRGGL